MNFALEAPAHGELPAERAFGFAAVVTVLIFLAGIYTPVFIVDSWSYLELSKTVFHDFYRFNTLRQFESLSPHSNTFPPLWPVVLAAVRAVVDLGIFTGYALNCFICVGLLGALMRLFKTIGFQGWVGAACYLSLLAFPPFLSDALAAKTHPLSLLLLIATLLPLAAPTMTARRAALGGLLMGLSCLTRFDVLPTACVIGVIYAVRAHWIHRQRRRTAAIAAVYFTTLVVVLSPWMAYGISHFGKPFPSDNNRQVIQARSGNVMDYFETPPPSDLAHNPRKWIAGLVGRKVPHVVAGFYTAAKESPTLIALVAVVLVVWGVTTLLPATTYGVWFTVAGLGLIPVLLFPASLVGYADTRYFSGPVLIIFGVLFAVLLSLTPDAWHSRRVALLLLVLAAPLARAIVHPLVYNRGRGLRPADAIALLSPTPDMQQVTDAVRRDAGGRPHRLLRTDGYIQSVKYGALTGEPTTAMPRLVGGTFAAFARDFHVTHLYNPAPKPLPSYMPPVADPDVVMRAVNTPGVELIPLDLPGLYRIQLTPSPTLP